MKTEIGIIALVAVLVTAGCTISTTPTGKSLAAAAPTSEWQEDFGIAKRRLVATGRNPYFILEPGFQLVYASEDEKLIITVLNDTMDIAGVTTRVVEEREWKHGKLIEVSRNFLAMCKDTKDVFYFGEDVDMYDGQKITSHDGAWRAGVSNAKPGLLMPGSPRVGMK